MRNELAFQTKIVNTLNDMGGHAFKCNNRFKAGILDIHCTLDRGKPIGGTAREVGSFFLECKFDRRVTLKGLSVAATPKQQQFALAEKNAGGVVHGLYFIQHAKERNQWQLLYFDPCLKDNLYSEYMEWRTGVPKWSAELLRFL